MCTASKDLIFCTCENENDKAEIIGEYKWTLMRYLGSKTSTRRGKIVIPSDELGAGINIKSIATEMTTRNCFDFGYTAQEKDCFHISNGSDSPDYKYFSLLFIDGKWIEGRYAAFGRTISEDIATGKVAKRMEDNQ